MGIFKCNARFVLQRLALKRRRSRFRKMAEQMLNDGAEILGTSAAKATRPGAGAVTEQEEVRRVVPAIRQ